MEFLQDPDDIDSDINSPEKSHKVVAIKCKWTDMSDDDDDDSAVEDTGTLTSKASSSSYLPKADDLFSSIVPQFALNMTTKGNEAAIKSKVYVPVEPSSDHKKVEAADFNNKKKVTKPILSSSNSTTADDVSKPTGLRHLVLGVKGATPRPAVPESKEADSAKDRVKRQRLSGQSGIGADFKTWKSEEEMRQRQQYD